MKYKFIATDYDYTLADTPNPPTEHAKKVIAEYQARGGRFTFVTGRMTKGIMARMNGINPSTPIATFQGAVVYDVYQNKVIKDWNISPEKAILLLDEFENKNYEFNSYINDELWLKREYERTADYCEANKIVAHYCNDLRTAIIDNNYSLPKMLLNLNPDDAKRLEIYYQEKFKGVFTVTRSSPVYLEFTDVNASKGNAVKWIAEQYGIAPEETICLGDSTNDISMLEYAGLGIAMGNAMDEVKAVADVVAKPCAEDGWAEIIEKYCL